MKEKVREILERELRRLDAISKEPLGLDLHGLKQLDLLIKCHASFVGSSKSEDESSNPDAPEAAPLDELLNGINNSDDQSEQTS